VAASNTIASITQVSGRMGRGADTDEPDVEGTSARTHRRHAVRPSCPRRSATSTRSMAPDMRFDHWT
jgi:hypothetical protein